MVAETLVLVVGAGPTGLLLASELCRRGVSCRVIDANPAPLHWDRATVVHPRSLEVFESLGIVEPLLAAGVKQRRVRVHSAGRILGEVDLSNCGSRFGFNIGISEEVTESILADSLRRHGGTVCRSSRLVDLEEWADGVVATIERPGKTERLSVGWVVGCDGFRSAARELCGIEMKGHDLQEPWAVFDATLPGWIDSYEANYAYLDEIPVILTALPGRRWRVYLRPGLPESDLVADAASTIGRYRPAVGFDEVAHPARFHCHTKVAARFRSGRVLLAGDAAHVCSPSQGHGMNSGLQDAFNLAWKLALVCRGHCAPALLDSYEAERRPVAMTVAAGGDDFDRAQVLTDPAERRARDESLRAAFADASSRHDEAVAEAELNIDYGSSPIVTGDRGTELSPGRRLPDDIDVSLAGGGSGKLHELTHRAGHTALVIGGASAEIDVVKKLGGSIRAHSRPSIIEDVVALTVRPDDGHACARLAPSAFQRLSVGELMLAVVRPDGHVGLRADDDHLKALEDYHALLSARQA